MDAIVQLVRNALCCVKDLNLFASSRLYDPSYTSQYYTFPSPHLNQTTPLELLIAITQLYACVTCTISGFKLILNQGVRKLRSLTKVATMMKDKYKDIKSQKVVSLIQKSIMNEANVALRNTFVGICVAAIGVAFFWLFANSLHITDAGWIGGLPALIHSLEVMEVALLPLLYLMLKDAARSFSKAERVRELLQKFVTDKSKVGKDDDTWIDLETFTLLQNSKWTPSWTESDAVADEKVLAKEVEGVETKIKLWTSGNATIISEDLAIALQDISVECKLVGYREYLYFVLNFIAFYGYLLGIICYYFDKDEDQHYVVTSLKFGTTNAVADWTGNFAGDLMWTIEPAIILLSPIIIRRMARQDKSKIKSD
jgi:hypothetical protein